MSGHRIVILSEAKEKKRGWVETLPRYKIQYPMKNHVKDATKKAERCTLTEIYFQQ